MDALEMSLLFDYYGGLLTDKQRDCYDMRYNQDLSLSEIGQILGVSRQAVCDVLTRTEAQLRKLEDNVGCVRRFMQYRLAAVKIAGAAEKLMSNPDCEVSALAKQIAAAARTFEE